MSATMTHDCGGTILRHPSPDPNAEPRDYLHCDRCHAFRYLTHDDDGLPDGTDRAANKAAWDDGDDESPYAVA